MNKRLEAAFKWCEENKERLKIAPKWSYQANKKNRKAFNKRQREYRKRPKNIVSDRLRHSVNYSLRRMNIPRDGKSLKEMVNYSIEDLTKRLKETIQEGYSWQDFLDGKLDIDHIKPIKNFNYNTYSDIEFKECWVLDNLRLLTISDNRSRRFNKE